MLPSDLLINRLVGETVIPKQLDLDQQFLTLANEQIACFKALVNQPQSLLQQRLSELEGDSTYYRIERGLNHLLKSHFSTFETISPIEPQLIRKRVFSRDNQLPPLPKNRLNHLEKIAAELSLELNKEVTFGDVIQGLYGDLNENQILVQFEAPTPEELIHRYNLSQVQGIFYRASKITLQAHRNVPGQYKLLFRYLKLFQLMAYIEGDAETGFTITLDGPTSLFKASTQYGFALAKMIPALLHVSRWSLNANLKLKDVYSKTQKEGYYSLDHLCGLISHYSPGKTYDSMIESSFVESWSKISTVWILEREVDLVPIPGSVMIPDFRLVHPNGSYFLLEIVGYWRKEYLQKKFAQVKKSQVNNFILAISERLNLEKAGVDFSDLPVQIIWFKEKLTAKAVLNVLEG